jgi:hypothetical protein
MSETSRAGFLIRGTKEKRDDDVFQSIIFPQDRATDRPSLLHTDAYHGKNVGTIRVQICCNSMVNLEHHRRNGRLFSPFPYLLIYRTEEAVGLKPARST